MVVRGELIPADGQKVKIETFAESANTYGKFPAGQIRS